MGEDGAVRLWYAEGPGESLILTGHGRVYASSFSPDGGALWLGRMAGGERPRNRAALRGGTGISPIVK